jgi:hypothetical protein
VDIALRIELCLNLVKLFSAGRCVLLVLVVMLAVAAAV